MAFTDFYMETTGSNLNSGSTTGAASVTSTNGSWDITANRFIAAGGATPFLSVTVGMYASIYLDAATNAVFVSKITAVDAGGTYIEVSKTANKIGTAPAALATGRSCKVGGAWADVGIASLFSTGAVDQPTRVNIKAGSYTTTALRNFAVAGTAAIPLWFRGYNTTLGDLDDYSSLTKPVWGATGSGRYQLSGAFVTISGLDITAAVANATVTLSAANITIHRCRITNTTANSASVAVLLGSGNHMVSCCAFNTTSSAPNINCQANSARFFGCVFTGGGTGIISAITTGVLVATRCSFRSLGGEGIFLSAVSAGHVLVDSCTFYGCGNHAIEFAATITAGEYHVINCNFWAITGNGINYSIGTICTSIFRAGNDFRLCSAGDENGLGDTPGNPGVSGATWGSQDEAVDPWTSATDMTPRIYSKAHQMGLPRTFEYAPYNTYADVGAVNSQNAPIPTVGGHVARRT